VSPGIHDDHINLEVWNVHPDCASTVKGVDDEQLKDEHITAVTEIELNVLQAQELIRQLQLAVSSLEGKPSA
jgi:hypothetical protein